VLAGHYAPAYLLRVRFPTVPLLALFVAVQAVDIAFFVLAPLGIEHLAVDPAARGPLAMELQSIPYTHSLTMTAVYTALLIGTGVVARRSAIGLALAIAVGSHWAMDLIVHLHDLPLTTAQEAKVGFGLWRYPMVSYLLEVGLVSASGWWLARRVISPDARRWIYGSVAILILIQTGYVFLPPPATAAQMAAGAEIIYLIAAVLAWQSDRRMLRSPGRVQSGLDR
jgi:hypothetical protein